MMDAGVRPPVAPQAPYQVRQQMQAQNEHHHLLSRVASLQTDLERSTAANRALREESAQWRKNAEELKTQLVETRRRYNDARTAYLDTAEAKMAVERQYEERVQGWKLQLEQKSKELEEWQSKLAPQDLDLLRLRVQQELEIPHQQQVRELEEEVAKTRRLLAEERREHEKCKTRFEMRTAEGENELQAQRVEHDRIVHMLRAQLANALADNSRDDLRGEVRTLQQQVRELEVHRSQLENEAENLRKDRDEHRAQHEQLNSNLHNRVSELQAKLAHGNAERARLEQIIAHLQSRVHELQATGGAGGPGSADYVRMEETVASLRNQLRASEEKKQRYKEKATEAIKRHTALSEIVMSKVSASTAGGGNPTRAPTS